ncbi:hypothetical protein BJ912DRAFT_928300 [Pholiota molesta]|nr:hypothetical protein BJ912DRAFT_928300 [Pholiota molesta]
MRDGFHMVARIPYPVIVPKYYAVASEVATMALLRSSGLPIPEVYGYLPVPDNAAETAYIFMEFVQGAKLSDVWLDLEEQEIVSVLRQLVQLEEKMIPGEDGRGPGIPLEEVANSDWQVVGLLDWQHAPILPRFSLPNYADPFSQSITPPLLLVPENFDELDATVQSRALELYHRRLVHHHYVKNTDECNELHHAALTSPLGVLRSRLFYHASEPQWDGEALEPKVVFDAEDVRETMKLDEVQREADEVQEACQNVLGFGPQGWVPTLDYEAAMACNKQMKADGLAACTSAEERAEIVGTGPGRHG